jgi:hypothetical protein
LYLRPSSADFITIIAESNFRYRQVAIAALEIVATHAVIALQVANDGFDGGATAHLAANGLGDTPDLAGDPDLEPVRMVVAAIALVAVDAANRNTCELFEIGDDGASVWPSYGLPCRRLGVQHELPAPGRSDRRGN